MNDRFDAQLRAHLLATAQTTPAADQLAGVLAAVSRTGQRNGAVAGLTWFPGRFGPLPIRTLRIVLLAAALIGAMIAGALYGGTRPGTSTVFEGTWRSIDPGDGSTQTLVVGTGGTPTVRYIDDLATGEACADAAIKVFTADGDGTLMGDRLTVVWPGGGSCGLQVVAMDPGVYDYDRASDTIHDGQELTWTRDRPGDAPSSDDPVTEPGTTPTSGPTPLPTPDRTEDLTIGGCFELPSGGAYSGTVGSIVLTATVPDRPVGRWMGIRDSFALTTSCVRGPSTSIHGAIVPMGPMNSCIVAGSTATTFAGAVAILSAGTPAGVIGPFASKIDGHDAARFDVSDLSGCPGGFGLQGGVILGAGEGGSIYVVDVDGILLSFELNARADLPQEQLDEARAIVASLVIGRLEPSQSPSAP